MACSVNGARPAQWRSHVRAACRRGFSGAIVALTLTAQADTPSKALLAAQWAEYEADAPKTIFELQPFRSQTQVPFRQADGREGLATLVNLNPRIGAWYILRFAGSEGETLAAYHLDTAGMASPLHLISGDRPGVAIAGTDGAPCDVGLAASGGVLDAASRSGLPYAPLCEGAIYVRNPVVGRQTSLERITDFLRDKVWGGDKIVAFVKKEFYGDAFLEEGAAGSKAAAAAALPEASGPSPADLSAEASAQSIVPDHLALDLQASGRELLPGRWYPLRDLPDVFASTIAPEHIASRIRLGHEASVNPLDAVEMRALVYLVAFHLGAFDLHFVLGTDHPRLDWSDRPPPSSRDARLPGPDGIASSAPVVRNGMVSPAQTDSTVATFTGGFKRSHGAFRFGALAERNHGSHYGFIEQGVIFSKLQPGLATALVLDDGTVDVRTWTREDDAQLGHVRYARQNGVPLIEYDAGRGEGVPGGFVNLWGPGNWSGSANEDLRTLRAGLCLQENARGRFLIYGYFSAATPSAMARVFQAYHCRYAMHLDMNALEHTYLALYARREGVRVVEHLVSGMEVLDRSARGQLAPRFLAFPDDRDFFYLTRRRTP